KFFIEGRLAREEIHVGGNFKAESAWDKFGRPTIAEHYVGDGDHTRQEWEYLPSGQLLMTKQFSVVHQPTPTGERRLFEKAGSFPIYRPDGSILEIHEFEDNRRVRVKTFDEDGHVTGDSGPL
ncbi:MAG TPA: hypothetical protein VFT74_21700, partial [Isosphaeraceae bacterium]|nr:hypothetical protein [Isosphaeraceae bacterium]